MHSENKEDYVILSPRDLQGREPDEILDLFFAELKEKISTFSNENLILDFSQVVNTDVTKILLFSPISGKQKDLNKSFVIVSERINADDIPEELLVVPTIQEAIDIIEIENIERDLGF